MNFVICWITAWLVKRLVKEIKKKLWIETTLEGDREQIFYSKKQL